MHVKKSVLDHIEKCYAVTEMEYDGRKHLICAAEGKGPCNVYSLDGTYEETLWNGPGGVMTLLQYPDSTEPVLLATQKFYSPDDSSEAKIVYYYRKGHEWIYETLCDLPHVHRFGMLEDESGRYLIAATLKSACAFEGDWTCPGRVWVAKIPESIFIFDREHQLKMEPLLSGLYKNHGFYIHKDGKEQYAVIGTENGIYKVAPMIKEEKGWKCEKIMEGKVSDMLIRDFDQDGKQEILTISPFHGDHISVYKPENERMVKVFERKEAMPFAHAICGGKVDGCDYAFLGGRSGTKKLISYHYDLEKRQYIEELLDEGAGAANCMTFRVDGKLKLFAANRETDEVAIYEW